MTTESRPTETFESKVNEKINEAVSEGERMLARIWRTIAANCGISPGRPVLATDTARSSLVEESSARPLNLQGQDGGAPRGGWAGS
jgi:hypothetical protein